MATEIKVPTLGESVTEATVARWLKKVGDTVQVDEALVELETDKVTLEVNAAAAGTLTEIVAGEGANVAVGALLGTISEGGAAAAPKPAAAAAPAPAPVATPAPVAAAAAAGVMPAARKVAEDNGVDPTTLAGTGKDGRVTKGDVIQHLETPKAAPAPAPAPKAAAPSGPRSKADLEERVRMSRLRQRIAERLKEAQNTAAMLTTFNEVDMTNVIAMRNQLKDAFEKKHGVKLGFMSFFVKACLVALKELPAVNAEIDGTDLVYKNYYDIGVAVGTPQGLVVPVVRDADKLSFAGVEKTIGELGKKARDGKLSMEDLSGGTFTISNGGVYGSLMSTPILNTPQSGILGMHKTMDRAVVVNGKVEVRPMMYLALSYDHRIIDGREAVTFLVRVKECIENPERILLDV
ncbi:MULTISPECIES: 2-oxoglutarate dehydrogenase complex dihydrolipoyllysine-residue succinyltransferase [unclassified Azospirillum]|uniref:2-oxoglutarate dehydrogenase complex dihydrolipoyllysine-residue succinyltransferase n=1 Tax=unclassified Azospirillum TaxID=2630922 RepID=UPI000B63ADAF|nr:MULTISPECIES: 2-oxoglutarate dehydrogenase complex dihydrolipoyllysine-residue succinyltransferase [unclassified Azospirillum]SNR85329.1 2-oxoglutarate dehydrogenase E2 component [Azospirillum sp. RU38E]SNS01235.1 2-oxoglutarate dehydrogenase E2 component [Azospirillum sp. RU37A]